MGSTKEIDYKFELARKGIHLLSILIPLFYALWGQSITLIIFIPITITVVSVDLLMKADSRLFLLVSFLFGKLLRSHEKNNKWTLTGASWVLISACVNILLFPKIIAITGLSVLVISDISAALIGKKFGRHPMFGKSLEGTLAFMVTALLTVGLIGYYSDLGFWFYVFGSIGSIVACLCELYSKKIGIDDNLSIPISLCFILWFGNTVLGLGFIG
jgi:dolichol kinase